MVCAASALALLLASVPLGACAVDGEEKTTAGEWSPSHGYQHAFDYDEYMRQATAPQGNQYVSKYASGYQGYVRTNASGVDYQKYTEQGHANPSHGFGEYAKSYAPHLRNSSDSQEWAAYYAKKYAGKFQGGMENSSSDEEALQHLVKSYMDMIAADYERYRKALTGASGAPSAAGKCHNMSDLDAWRAAQLERIHAFVPQAYRAPVQDKVERKFRSNRARIMREEARIMREEAAEAQQHVHQASNQSADRTSGGFASGHANRTEDASGEQRKPPVRESSAAPQHADEAADRPATRSAAKVQAKRAEDSSLEQKPRTEESDAAAKPPTATALAQQGFDGEQFTELAETARRNRIDRSMALIGSVAAFGAIVSALVIARRNQQSSSQPEGYVNLEP